MWLLTPIGFFSIVQKASDIATNTLTIRSRVRSDLEALRELYLPGLGDISENSVTDYRFRATAPRAEVAAAMAELVNALEYSNFKNQVAKVQGGERAHLYHEVWDTLYKLQSNGKKYAFTAPGANTPDALVEKPAKTKANAVNQTIHPRLNEHKKPVILKKPSQPTELKTWETSDQLARVIPNGAMPAEVNGLAISSWTSAPKTSEAWESLAAEADFVEPEFKVPAGYKKAAGVVLREPDGRVWVVMPSNEFAGYQATFPKGTVDKGRSLKTSAMVEAYEESGLQVRLISHLVDVKRTLSYTRYYLAERVGGNPADMGWESQAVALVPKTQLPAVLTNANDLPVIEALNHVN